MNYSYRFTSTRRTLHQYSPNKNTFHVVCWHRVWCVVWYGLLTVFVVPKDNSLASLFVENIAHTHECCSAKESRISFPSPHHSSTYCRFSRCERSAGRFLRRPKLCEFSLGRFSPTYSGFLLLLPPSWLASLDMYIPPPLCRHVCHRDNQLRNACRYLVWVYNGKQPKSVYCTSKSFIVKRTRHYVFH